MIVTLLVSDGVTVMLGVFEGVSLGVKLGVILLVVVGVGEILAVTDFVGVGLT